jgi:tetratricopeptide (TPR) repeat protein
MVRTACAWLAAAAQWPLSLRGVCVLFFLMAAGLGTASWLRAPVSPNLSGLHLPLGAGPHDPEEVLYGPRRPLGDSLGGLLLLVIAVATLAVLWRPARFALAAGVLFAVALAANAAALFNYPALVELLDLEQRQRHQMITTLRSTGEAPPLSSTGSDEWVQWSPQLNGRVSAAGAQDQEWGGLFRGWIYLHYAPYLVGLAAAGVILGTHGGLARRLAHLAAWAGVGVLLVGAACWPRLCAEYHWRQAKVLEARCDFDQARQELTTAVAYLPALGQMQRTQLLAGKLDCREGRHTPEAGFFRAFQYGLHKEWSVALAQVTHEPSVAVADSSAVRTEAARLATAAGVRAYLQGRLADSQDLCNKACRLAPEQRAARLVLGLAQARQDRNNPRLAEDAFGPVLGKALGDRRLRADCLTLVADSYFDAGQLEAARRCYAAAIDIFALARRINVRAQKGLGGL